MFFYAIDRHASTGTFPYFNSMEHFAYSSHECHNDGQEASLASLIIYLSLFLRAAYWMIPCIDQDKILTWLRKSLKIIYFVFLAHIESTDEESC